MTESEKNILLNALALTEIQLSSIKADSPHYAQAQLTLEAVENMRCDLLEGGGERNGHQLRDGERNVQRLGGGERNVHPFEGGRQNTHPSDLTSQNVTPANHQNKTNGKRGRGQSKGVFLKPGINKEDFLKKIRSLFDASYDAEINQFKVNGKNMPSRRFITLIYSMFCEHGFAIELPANTAFYSLIKEAISDAPYSNAFTLAYNTLAKGLKEWAPLIGRNEYDDFLPINQVSLNQATSTANKKKLAEIKADYADILQLSRNQGVIAPLA